MRVGARLDAIADNFVEDRLARTEFDRRYYLVRYPWMREGNSGIYYGADHALGYELTMLRMTVQRSWYRDPYLYAVWRESGSPKKSLTRALQAAAPDRGSMVTPLTSGGCA